MNTRSMASFLLAGCLLVPGVSQASPPSGAGSVRAAGLRAATGRVLGRLPGRVGGVFQPGGGAGPRLARGSLRGYAPLTATAARYQVRNADHFLTAASRSVGGGNTGRRDALTTARNELVLAVNSGAPDEVVTRKLQLVSTATMNFRLASWPTRTIGGHGGPPGFVPGGPRDLPFPVRSHGIPGLPGHGTTPGPFQPGG